MKYFERIRSKFDISKLKQLSRLLDFNDLFILGGAVLIFTGIWQIYRPAAFIASGLALFWFGFTGARAGSKK